VDPNKPVIDPIVGGDQPSAPSGDNTPVGDQPTGQPMTPPQAPETPEVPGETPGVPATPPQQPGIPPTTEEPGGTPPGGQPA